MRANSPNVSSIATAMAANTSRPSDSPKANGAKSKPSLRPLQSPEAERERIKTAIGLFEQKVGAKTGTSVDIHGTFFKTGKYQLDCVDESTNTTVYLSLLQQKGLIRFHRVEGPSVRLPLIHAGRWPHQTAVITELNTSEFFAVDSWFHDNGAPAEIISLKEWKEGWKPNADSDS